MFIVSPRLPQELCELVIDQLSVHQSGRDATSKRALLTCALVCRAWLPGVRRALDLDIVLNNEEDIKAFFDVIQGYRDLSIWPISDRLTINLRTASSLEYVSKKYYPLSEKLPVKFLSLWIGRDITISSTTHKLSTMLGTVRHLNIVLLFRQMIYLPPLMVQSPCNISLISLPNLASLSLHGPGIEEFLEMLMSQNPLPPIRDVNLNVVSSTKVSNFCKALSSTLETVRLRFNLPAQINLSYNKCIRRVELQFDPPGVRPHAAIDALCRTIDSIAAPGILELVVGYCSFAFGRNAQKFNSDVYEFVRRTLSKSELVGCEIKLRGFNRKDNGWDEDMVEGYLLTLPNVSRLE